ncbi:uncharacterized protein TRIADDRAFT_56964 [Trichoplax adhaerens]|uniref:JmjC domain-containing protein n=1 Tax=Trichoplax adhaerens TaxID=10228 RepID=B3RX20_TRIAD|nr:hypothetical protein TRIADDRAFT_56964 [Trichoplax adhaerens]EDV25231.1 hypothetical protein TRIADDRAFT_56964 [Trichoplax adhaerens]|eukprot:XP_002113121.1 hypothetical protein TRIADDRAFT_56964 [Trichoplax adhaerens]
MKSIAIPYLIIVLYHFYNSEYVQAKDTKGLPGHLKPLGHSGRHIEITEINGFPSLKTFFKQHVSQSKPLVMRGAAKIYPAFSKWSDDYFLSLPETSTAEIDIQQRKKQNYSLPYLRATLAEFLHRYNHTDEYMVSYIPSHLKTDLYLPPCVQCDDLIHIEPVMWLSNGGTKSILHADQNHNINCLIRGTKDFILINKDTPDQTFIDAPGTYSYVDVDRVDMDKYPVFSSIDFYDTHIEAGDCIFVPASWFHQVRSYGYNIAVNIWLKGEDKFFDVSSCQDVTKAYKTLDQFTYSLVEPPSHDGRDELDEGAEMFRQAATFF